MAILDHKIKLKNLNPIPGRGLCIGTINFSLPLFKSLCAEYNPWQNKPAKTILGLPITREESCLQLYFGTDVGQLPISQLLFAY